MKQVEIIGKFYDNHSLAIINREIAIKLSDKEKYPDIELAITPLDQHDSQYKIISSPTHISIKIFFFCLAKKVSWKNRKIPVL